MGLDMYAYAVKDSPSLPNVDILYPDLKKMGVVEVAYWRKFNHLHGWMERLYYDKGGASTSFNCTTVRVTKDDLDRLVNDANGGRLEATEGCFFGDSTLYPEDMESLHEFAGKASTLIDNGYAIFYDSWW
jgi:hypothetical protein